MARNWLVHHRPFALTSPPTNPHPHLLQLSLRRCERERRTHAETDKEKSEGSETDGIQLPPYGMSIPSRSECTRLSCSAHTPHSVGIGRRICSPRSRRFQNLCFEIFKTFYSAYGGGAPLPQGESLSSAPSARFLVEPGAWTRVRLTEL